MEINSNIEVSVIIPTKNRKNFIEEFTIPSLCKQTFKGFEVIFVDDSDTDETERYLKTIKDINIIYIHGRNCLIAGARNDGVKNANGRYIAYLDDDEIWFENKLEVCLNALKNNKEYLFAYHKSYRRKLGDSTLEEWLPDWNKDYLFEVSNIIPSSNVMMRKELFDKYGGFSEDIRIFPRCDWEYWARLTQYTEFLFIPQFLGIYQEHPASVVVREREEDEQLTKEHNEFIRIYIHKYRNQDTCTIIRDRMEMQRKLDELWSRVMFQWNEIEKNKNLISGLIDTGSNMNKKLEEFSSQVKFQLEESGQNMGKNLNEVLSQIRLHKEEVERIKNFLTEEIKAHSNKLEGLEAAICSMKEDITGIRDLFETRIEKIISQQVNQEERMKEIKGKLTPALYKLNDMYTSRFFQIYRWLQRIFHRRKD